MAETQSQEVVITMAGRENIARRSADAFGKRIIEQFFGVDPGWQFQPYD